MFTALLDNQFDLLPEILHELFVVITPIGDSFNDEEYEKKLMA